MPTYSNPSAAASASINAAQSSTEPSTNKSKKENKKKENKKKENKSVKKTLRAHQMERRLETAAERDSSVAAFLQDFAKASAASGDEAAYTNSFLSAIKALKPEIRQAQKWAQKTIEKDLKLSDSELAMFQKKEKGEELVDSRPWWSDVPAGSPPGSVIPYNPAPVGDGGTQKYRQKAGVSYDPSMYQDLASPFPTAPNSDRRLASLARYREALPRIARLKARMALNDPSLRAFGNATQPNVGRSGVPLAYDPNSPFRVRKNY